MALLRAGKALVKRCSKLGFISAGHRHSDKMELTQRNDVLGVRRQCCCLADASEELSLGWTHLQQVLLIQRMLKVKSLTCEDPWSKLP